MTGLDKILGQIADDAKESADGELSLAKAEAGRVLEEARLEGEKQVQAVIAAGQAAATEIKKRAESSSQLERRNELLAFKQNYINEVVSSTMASLEALPDEEYFEILLKLLKKYAQKSAGVMKLCKRDLSRLPSGFAEKAAEAAGSEIKVSSEAAEISAGFLLIYEGIDINCSFEAIFADKADAIHDKASEILFA